MSKLLIINIKELVNVEYFPKLYVKGHEMSDLLSIPDAFLLIENEKISDFGPMSELNNISSEYLNINTIDAKDKFVFPSYCDSHTHLVYAGSREIEYVDKIKGLSYEEIAKRGGGILNSSLLLQNTSEDDLYFQSYKRLETIIRYGTGAVEIKSGYGLSLENELKMLRVIKNLKQNSPLTIKSTFLGAHAVPKEFKSNQTKFVDIVINEMLPMVAEEGLADFVDVFCDKGFFTIEETERILEAASKFGLIPKIHANELDYSGGIQTGVKFNALSVDHLEYTGDAEIEALLHSTTMPTVLPGAAFFLGMIHAPVRKMIQAGLPVALASDFNPGSAPSGNMQLISSMGCIQYRMLPEEVIFATTLNTAYAMGVSNQLGSIAKGKIANVWISKEIPSYQFVPYSFGDNKVETAILNGEVIIENQF